MRKITYLLLIPLFTLTFNIQANIKLPALVSNNMVLQQLEKITVWGWADANESIIILPSWTKKKYSTITTPDGKWSLNIKTPKAGGPYTIKIKGNNTIDIENVMIGEVWLCSGQSNMHLMVGKYGGSKDWRTGVDNYEEEIANANYPKIRMFTVDRKTSDSILSDVKGSWLVCSPDTVGGFSAVAYFFGRELHKKLNVPIGLLNTSWGGTPAEAWTRKDILEADTGLTKIIDRYQFIVDHNDSIRNDYKKRLDTWKKGVDDNSITGKEAQSAPRAPLMKGSHKAPYLIYNAMIAPLLNYRIKGAIWYQGENNAQMAWQYRTLFPAMINNWRTDFSQGDFPFYFVQIAPHRSQNPEIRESQLLTYRKVKNTGIAVTTDAGDTVNIHPTNKQIVGYRLSLWALAKTYKQKGFVYSGPLYKGMKIDGNKIRCQFDFVGDGLICKGDSLTHFTICGIDKKFVTANAIIEDNEVVVWSNEVKNPVAVRFGWEHVPMHNFFNKNGLPASPFRTDDWPGKTYGKN
ncbi:MAG: hypothetical protein JW717_02115 [Marinilabiliaceae bacterium]|nr:hypothetical protein [Marinilabiliaceae bacterium]